MPIRAEDQRTEPGKGWPPGVDLSILGRMNRLAQQDNSTPYGVWNSAGAEAALQVFMEEGKYAWAVMVPEEPGYEPTRWSVWLMPNNRWAREIKAAERKSIMELVEAGKCPYAVLKDKGTGYNATFEWHNKLPDQRQRRKQQKKAS